MPRVFEEILMREIRIKNRIVVSPMCQYSSVDGFANDWHLTHLGTRAIGGAGLVFTEATSISPEGRISPGDLGIWKDDHIEKLKKITAFIEQQHAVPGIQLAHAGRKASHHSPWEGNKALTPIEGAWQTCAPSQIPYDSSEPSPTALNEMQISKILQDFRLAAKRAIIAGFKVLEIHAAHGYLIHQFLSPLSNIRKDKYGGAFENRIRLLLDIIEVLRQEWPAGYPIFVRISATDWVDGGWDIDDSVALAKILKQKEIDLIDCSSGGNSRAQKIIIGPMYQVPFSEKIKKESGCRTGAVGLITSIEQCNDIIEKEKADLIFLARKLLRDPYFPIIESNDQNYWPNQYLRAKV